MLITISRRLVALAAAVLALAGAGGYLLGVHNTKRADWHTAVARVMGEPGDPQVYIREDGWSYGIEGGVVPWIDEYGTVHDGTWPECLEPEPIDSVQGRAEVLIRFATVEVDSDDLGWRPVVMVDCGPAVG